MQHLENDMQLAAAYDGSDAIDLMAFFSPLDSLRLVRSEVFRISTWSPTVRREIFQFSSELLTVMLLLVAQPLRKDTLSEKL